MAKPELALSVNGREFIGWKSVNIILSMETLSGAFTLGLSDAISANSKPVKLAPSILPGDACALSIDGETVITGYIDSLAIDVDATSHTVTVTGRDKTSDLIDCSVIGGKNQWINVTCDKIIKDICQPFDIPIKFLVEVGEKIPSFVVEQGSPAFESIQKLGTMRQMLALSDGLGGLVMTQTGTDLAQTQLIEGVNIKAGIANYDYSQRHSLYIVKAQSQYLEDLIPTDATINTQLQGSYEDKLIKRYRPLVVIAENANSQNDCLKRAKWECKVRGGKSKSFNVTVTGWQQASGKVWKVNTLVSLMSALLGVKETLLISEVNFLLDDSGTTTQLKLVPPDAYSLNPLPLIDKHTIGLLETSNA